MSAPSIVAERPVHYPCSDGERMADNTLQYRWIVTLHGNLDAALPDAFVAGDLLWYPVEGDNKTRRAPDVLVAHGRPKGERGSYLQWKENHQPPDVVVEVWSPSNTYRELLAKLKWYDRFGVREFIMWDPDRIDLTVWTRTAEGALEVVSTEGGYTSPYLGGCTLQLRDRDLYITDPSGQPFKSFAELHAERAEARQRADEATARADQESARAQQEAARAQQEAARAQQEAARAEALAAKLRELGIDPATVTG